MKREILNLNQGIHPRKTKCLMEYAEAFCEAVNSTASQSYKDAKEILSEYLSGNIGANDLATKINRHVDPTPWKLRVEHRGRGQTPRFTFDPDARGTMDAWRELAQILGDGISLERMKLCAWTKCEKLFYDSSPRGDRTACSDKCRHARDSQTHRRKLQRLA